MAQKPFMLLLVQGWPPNSAKLTSLYCFFYAKGRYVKSHIFQRAIGSKLPKNDSPKFNLIFANHFFNTLENFHKENMIDISFVTSYWYTVSKRVLTPCIYNLNVVKISFHFWHDYNLNNKTCHADGVCLRWLNFFVQYTRTYWNQNDHLTLFLTRGQNDDRILLSNRYCSFHISMSKAFWRSLFYYLLFLAETFMMCVNVFYVPRNEISADRTKMRNFPIDPHYKNCPLL